MPYRRSLCMKLFLLSLLAVFVLASLSSLVESKGSSINSCMTPTPPGTTVGFQAYNLEFSATKTITLTTVYTLRNLETSTAYFSHQFLNLPECMNIASPRHGTLPSRGSKVYFIDDLSNFPDTWTGEVYIFAGQRLTETHKIISRTRVFMPLVNR